MLSDPYLLALFSGSSRWREVVKGYVGRILALLGARQFDVVSIEKELFPFMPAIAERFLRLIGLTAERKEPHHYFQVNTVKDYRVLSFSMLALRVIKHMQEYPLTSLDISADREEICKHQPQVFGIKCGGGSADDNFIIHTFNGIKEVREKYD